MELQAAVGLVRRRWWIVVAALVFGLVAAGIYSGTRPEIYRAGARLYVNVPNASDTREAIAGVEFTTQLITTFARVATSEKTTKIVSEDLDNTVSPGQVKSKVSAVPVPQTTLIDVRASDRNPALAANLANATANALTAVIEELGDLSTGGVKASVIDEAHVPRNPVSPQPRRDLVLGGLLGLALGAVGALTMDALDRTIRESSIAAAAFDAPLLTSIPKQRRLSSDPLVALKSGGSPTGEAYRALRTAVRFRDAAHPLRTVLVTSAASGDGKSTIAANLAIAMSLDGAKVILIDADLRRTRLATMFDLAEGGPGLTNVLMGKIKLSDALVAWSRGLSVLQVGTHSLNPSEALGSQAMVDVLEHAKQLADIVIVDAPPVLPVADPAVLAALVDGTVVVCRWGKTSLHAAEATRTMLENVGANVIGVVFNAEGGGRSANYYRHYSTRPQHRRGDNGDSAASAASASANAVGAAPAAVSPEVSPSAPDGS
ncbi:MAG TPA: polysaccharide biosynthesis tyrosine autokinase [Acidimicrobiales bacterium]|nr:polysaccharide biosynthesis tyrosine autokinase [Acidimicrobiales bacterium]